MQIFAKKKHSTVTSLSFKDLCHGASTVAAGLLGLWRVAGQVCCRELATIEGTESNVLAKS